VMTAVTRARKVSFEYILVLTMVGIEGLYFELIRILKIEFSQDRLDAVVNI